MLKLCKENWCVILYLEYFYPASSDTVIYVTIVMITIR